MTYVPIYFFFFSVIGSAMTFGVFDTVNLDMEGSAKYCPAFLYRFTYSTAILVSLKLCLITYTLFTTHLNKFSQKHTNYFGDFDVCIIKSIKKENMT